MRLPRLVISCKCCLKNHHPTLIQSWVVSSVSSVSSFTGKISSESTQSGCSNHPMVEQGPSALIVRNKYRVCPSCRCKTLAAMLCLPASRTHIDIDMYCCTQPNLVEKPVSLFYTFLLSYTSHCMHMLYDRRHTGTPNNTPPTARPLVHCEVCHWVKGQCVPTPDNPKTG